MSPDMQVLWIARLRTAGGGQYATEAPLAQVADELAPKGETVFANLVKVQQSSTLTAIRTGHAQTDPTSLITIFYAMLERTAASRGINSEQPRHLKKVIKTV